MYFWNLAFLLSHKTSTKVHINAMISFVRCRVRHRLRLDISIRQKTNEPDSNFLFPVAGYLASVACRNEGGEGACEGANSKPKLQT